MKTNLSIKKFILFSFIASLIVLLNCSDRNLEPLEGDIKFSIAEGYEDHDLIESPRIMLSMVTEKIYPCCNYSIISEISVKSKIIAIELIGIYIPEVGLTALGPASASSFLDISEGEYQLYFYYRNTKDKYILTVTDSFIKITEEVAQFTNPEFNLYWRYPRNSFAYLCGTITENSWLGDDFLDTVLSKITFRQFQFPDSGKIPYPCSSMGHYYNMPARYFLYEKDENFDKAGEILTSYTQNVIVYYPGTSISLINWKNKKYYSWLFEK
ncbi:MAG: hypothetical protein OEW87_13620 [Flavobacteriaceae bacterium]|nr:hypothetical protein [Flavobacteriaceae bacterium]MDH5684644.1 hypothetical protein [candidate division WOR-3 bacterium]